MQLNHQQTYGSGALKCRIVPLPFETCLIRHSLVDRKETVVFEISARWDKGMDWVAYERYPLKTKN